MNLDWLKFGLLVGFIFGFSPRAEAVDAIVNPQFLVDGPVKIGKIDPDAYVYSYGFRKSTWLSQFGVTVYIKRGLSKERKFEIAAKALKEASEAVSKTNYSLDGYLSPRNPVFYRISLDEDISLADRPTSKFDYFSIRDGYLCHIKGRDVCSEEEKIILDGYLYGCIWKKPIEEALANTGVDLSFLERDPNLVFDISDNPEIREVVKQEVKRIDALSSALGYDTLGNRLTQTGLRNKGEIREWFFEYALYREKKTWWFQKISFDVEQLKKEWLKQARFILKELNTSQTLTPYRKKPWNLRSLKFNLELKYDKQSVNQTCFVGWSHMVFENMRFTWNGGIADYKVVRIPLDEFYAWAEEELKKNP